MSKTKLLVRTTRDSIRYITHGKTPLEKSLGVAAIFSIGLVLIYIIYWFVAGTFWNKYTSLMFMCIFYAIFLLFLRFKCEITSRELQKNLSGEAKRLGLTEKDALTYLEARKEVEIASDWIWVTIAFIVISLLILSFPG